jgi:hypothetical protein
MMTGDAFMKALSHFRILQPYGNTSLPHCFLGLSNGVLAEVENTGRKCGIGVTNQNCVGKMFRSTSTTAGYHGD